MSKKNKKYAFQISKFINLAFYAIESLLFKFKKLKQLEIRLGLPEQAFIYPKKYS